jgi:methylaspartate mutase epsilon subunit
MLSVHKGGVSVEISCRRWPREKFIAQREQVLTGQGLDLEDAVKYQQALPEAKRSSRVLAAAREHGRTLVQVQAGAALLEDQGRLMRFLEQEGADCLSAGAEICLQHGRPDGEVLLGYGVGACRQLVQGVSIPLQLRHEIPDARLAAEIALAAGFTDILGGGISFNIPFAKDLPLAKTIAYWQYVDRLVGWYQEAGVDINREPYGPLTGTLVPPSISHAVAILEAILAAEQGVKFITLGYAQGGNFAQDVAAILSLQKLAQEYLAAQGHQCQVSTAFYQWLGGFPQDEAKAFGVIGLGAAVAALSGAAKVVAKTPREAQGLPDKEARGQGVKATKQVVNMLLGQAVPHTPEIEAEQELIVTETRCILEAVHNLGQGDWALGAVRAFASGVLDVPFASSGYAAGRLLPVRDVQGAVRLLDFGNLPFTREIRDLHRRKLEERGRREGRSPSYQMVIDDIYAISKGVLVGGQQGPEQG